MGIETNLEVFPGISFQTSTAVGYQAGVIDAAKYGRDPLTGLLNSKQACLQAMMICWPVSFLLGASR